MPRITTQLFVDRHRFLHFMWQDFRHVYALLDQQGQRNVYAYFRPDENLSVEQLVEHRKQISAERPSLAAAAGKSFAVINEAFRDAREQAGDNVFLFNQILKLHAQPGSFRSYPVERQHGKQVTLTISAVRKPNPDMQKLARAIVAETVRRLEDERDQAA